MSLKNLMKHLNCIPCTVSYLAFCHLGNLIKCLSLTGFSAGILNAESDYVIKLWDVYICSTPPLHRYFLLCVNYFFYGETVTDYFFSLVQREEPLRILSKYHRFISFALYLTGKNAAGLERKTKRSSYRWNCERVFTDHNFSFCKCVTSSCQWATSTISEY